MYDGETFKSSEGLTYKNSKLDIYKLKSLEIPIIQECHDLCSCDVKKCPNRVIQHGIQNRLEIFRTESKGWGLRSPQRIQKATVIYTGVITSQSLFKISPKRKSEFSFFANIYGLFMKLTKKLHNRKKEVLYVR